MTRRRLLAGGGALFEAEAWKPIQVKGSPEPQAVHQLLSARPQVAQQPAAVARAPLTGRDAELKRLKERFKTAVSARQPQLVAVIGPAGIGKTRVRLEFGNWLEESCPAAQVWLGRAFSYSSIRAGIPLILFGYFKKVVIADWIFVQKT